MEIVFLVHANGPNKSLSTRTESLPSKLDVSSTLTTLLHGNAEIKLKLN